MSKCYTGCCGYCKHMDLYSGYTFCYSTSFNCAKSSYKHSVKADDKACNKFELDSNRSNDMIAKYDK